MDERKGSQKRCAGESSSSSSALAKANDFVAQHGREHDLLETIQALRKEQKEQREKRKQITKSLRNAKKRKMRIQKKAQALSNEDLVELMKLRSFAVTKEPEPVAGSGQGQKKDDEAPPEDGDGNTES